MGMLIIIKGIKAGRLNWQNFKKLSMSNTNIDISALFKDDTRHFLRE
jgi:hypothetical protein